MFCREHGCPPGWLECLHEFSAALEKRDVKKLKELIEHFRGGSFGSFRDWVPRVGSAGEDAEYAECVQRALTEYWLDRVQPIESASDA